MTIIFKNHKFKYEIEATVKLFIPATSFEFVYDEKCSDSEVVFTEIRRGKSYNLFLVYVRKDGKVIRKATFINNDENISEEYILCRLVFECLEELTGKTCEWGLLTGIRPVKKFNMLIEQGYSKSEIFGMMKDKYLISDKKAELAYLTAQTQLPLLRLPDKKKVGLYISIPFCPTRCSYCSFVSHSIESAKKLVPQYVEKLCEEIEITGKLIADTGISVDTVYIGGGTPTSLSAEQLGTVMKKLSESVDLSGIREYTVEAGRPDTITAEKLETIKKLGADRISVNPQTLNNDVLKAIGRNHSAEQIFEAYEMAGKTGFKAVNMDLIAGLPTDTIESFRKTIDGVIALDPENITVHTLTLKRSSTLFPDGKSQIENPVSEMVDYAQEKLIENGYLPYYLYRQKNTVDNLENVGYSKRGYESLYNIFIMDEIQTIIGVGCSASTKLVTADGKITRIHNYKFPYEYINRFDELMLKKSEIYNFFGYDR